MGITVVGVTKQFGDFVALDDVSVDVPAGSLTACGPHHTVLTQAVGAESLRDFAEMVRTELLVIDEKTTPDDFADRVRWNQAYYRLARPL